MKRKEALEQGLPFYHTGKRCKYGNIAARVTSTGRCTCSSCRKARSETTRRSLEKRLEDQRLSRSVFVGAAFIVFFAISIAAYYFGSHIA